MRGAGCRSFYGADNGALLNAPKGATCAVCGVAVVADDVSDVELDALHAAGVRGVRFNIVDIQTAKGVLPMERIRSIANRDRAPPLGTSNS